MSTQIKIKSKKTYVYGKRAEAYPEKLAYEISGDIRKLKRSFSHKKYARQYIQAVEEKLQAIKDAVELFRN